MRRKTIVNLLICLVVMLTLAACNPTVPDEPGTQTSATPSVSSPPPCSTLPPVGTSITGTGKWQTLSSGNEVLDLLVNGNEVWVATTGGVVRWNAEDGTYRRYTTLDGLASNTVREIVQDGQGNIWVICYLSGVSRFDGDKWVSFNVENGLCSNDTITLAADKKGGVWVSAYWGVSYFDGEQWSSYSNVDSNGPVIGGSNPMKDCQNLTFVNVELSAVDDIFTDSRGNRRTG